MKERNTETEMRDTKTWMNKHKEREQRRISKRKMNTPCGIIGKKTRKTRLNGKEIVEEKITFIP